MQEVRAFCKFDIFANDTFYVGSRVYRPKRGLAIGGTRSAQLASICFFMSEIKGYPAWVPLADDPKDTTHKKWLRTLWECETDPKQIQ